MTSFVSPELLIPNALRIKLDEEIQHFSQSKNVRCTVVFGKSGMGKTIVVNYFVDQVGMCSANMNALIVHANPHHQHENHAFMNHLLHKVADILGNVELVESLSLVDQFQQVVGSKSLVVVIENAHFCDAKSWESLYLLSQKSNLHLMLLLTMKPSRTEKLSMRFFNATQSTLVTSFADSQPKPITNTTQFFNPSTYNLNTFPCQKSNHFHDLLNQSNTAILMLQPLNAHEIHTLLQHAFGTFVSSELTQLILDVSGGHFVWCKHAVEVLQQQHLHVANPSGEDWKAIEECMQTLIVRRMQILSTDYQQVLQYAAVSGEKFTEKLLVSLLPKMLNEHMADCLYELEDEGFILSSDDETFFHFVNNFIRNGIVRTVDPRVVASIHQAVAEFIESEYSENLRPFYNLLAYHYTHALGQRRPALKYQLKAANYAIVGHRFQDVIIHLQSANKLSEQWEEYQAVSKISHKALEVIKHIPPENQEDRVLDLTEIKNYADNQVTELQLAQQEVEEHQKDVTFHYRDSDYSTHHSNKASHDICTIQ